MDQLAGLTEEARRLALDRFRLLQPHLEDDRPLKLVAAGAGIPFRTAQRWVARYQQSGLTALARRTRADRGAHRAVSVRMREAIEGVALQRPPLPIAAVCRHVRRLAQRLGEEPPSYGVVYRIVSALPADLVTLAHHGSQAYRDTFELVHRREAGGSNAMWQADHTPLDILLVRSEGHAAKPWLTVVIDDYSRAVAGYFLSFEDPSALHTSLALRQAIWRKADARWMVCGIPEVLYTDNGLPQKSRDTRGRRASLRRRPVGKMDIDAYRQAVPTVAESHADHSHTGSDDGAALTRLNKALHSRWKVRALSTRSQAPRRPVAKGSSRLVSPLPGSDDSRCRS